MLFSAPYFRLPRIRGGVSASLLRLIERIQSSPHTRGCFLYYSGVIALRAVFPAYAGVFLLCRFRGSETLCLPRIRGGVSSLAALDSYCKASSPHTRGCFSPYPWGAPWLWVFPAYAGVFPRVFITDARLSCLPRIRGGVSFVPGLMILCIASSPHTRGCFRVCRDFRVPG